MPSDKKSKKRKTNLNLHLHSKKMSKKQKKEDYLHLARLATQSRLETFIKKANKAYYNTGIPLLEDNEYDRYIKKLL